MLNKIKEQLENLEFVDNVKVIDHLTSSKKAMIDVEMYGKTIRLFYHNRQWTKKNILWNPFLDKWSLILVEYDLEKRDTLETILEMISKDSWKEYLESLCKSSD